MRYPLEVFEAVREVWPDEKPISVRISATDWVDGGFDGDDAVAFAAKLKERGCDLIDVSTGQTTIDADPEYGRLYQTPYSDRIRNEVGIATMTVGAVSSIDDVHNILVAGRADLCLLARPHIVDPYWTLNAAIDLGYDGHTFPNQYLRRSGDEASGAGPDPPGCLPEADVAGSWASSENPSPIRPSCGRLSPPEKGGGPRLYESLWTLEVVER